MVSRTLGGLSMKKCKCGKKAMHTTWIGGKTWHRCCECHIINGGAPADWHPDCVYAFKHGIVGGDY